ncbi:Major Facilitator Superfamily protein [Celeribacter indicus]|nr:Major Facilitator Superfamily protein [Celeribacter indicus]
MMVETGHGPASGRAGGRGQADAPGRQAQRTGEASPAVSDPWRVLPPIMLAMALAMADQTMIASSLPLVVSSLGDAERVGWVLIGFMMTSMISAPVYGGLGDVFRRKRMMIVALTVFACGAVLSALSVNLDMLILARILQGIGGGGLMTSAQALLGETVPVQERARYQGYLGGITVSCASLGPVLGGVIGDLLGWRAIFLASLPVAAVTVVLVMRLPDSRRSGAATAISDWRFDGWGLAWFAGFSVALLVALEQVKRAESTALAGLAVCAVAASLCLIGLIRRERRASHPLLPLDLLSEAPLRYSNMLVLLHGCVMLGLISFMPLYLRVEHGLSATRSGVMLLLLTGGLAVGALVGGKMVSHTRRTTIFPAAGLSATTVILTVLVFAMEWVTIPQLGLAMCLIGMMMGSTMGVAQLLVQIASGPRAIGVTAGFLLFSRSLGSALGVALALMILFVAMKSLDPGAMALFEARLDGSFAAGPADAALLKSFQLAIGMLAMISFFGAVVAWRHPMRRF